MSSRILFPKTTNALGSLEKSLFCMSCQNLMKKPVALATCDHMFCLTCVEGKDKCPKCLIPVWAQDLKVNKQLEEISNACVQLRENVAEFTNGATKQNVNGIKQTEATPKQVARKRVSSEHVTPGKASRKFEPIVTPKNSKRLKPSACKTPRSAQKNKKGETGLHIAAIQGNLSSLTTSLEEGVDVNLKDNAGWSALHEACIHGHTEIVKQLLKFGALVDIPGHGNDTPLMDAVASHRIEIVKLLLEAGADISLCNSVGKTAKSFAKTDEMKTLLATSNHVKSSVSRFQPKITMMSAEMKVSFSSSIPADKIEQFEQMFSVTVCSTALSATHFVTPVNSSSKAKRTLKYLQAMACGAWMLSETWLDVCLEKKSLVEELTYQVKSCCDDVTIGGPVRSATSRLRQLPRLFDGCHFFLHGTFSSPYPKKQQLSELIQAADGKILSRSPKPDSDCVQACNKVPYYAAKDSELYYFTYYIVFDPTQPVPPRNVKQGKVNTVPVTWVLDCIARFSLV